MYSHLQLSLQISYFNTGYLEMSPFQKKKKEGIFIIGKELLKLDFLLNLY